MSKKILLLILSAFSLQIIKSEDVKKNISFRDVIDNMRYYKIKNLNTHPEFLATLNDDKIENLFWELNYVIHNIVSMEWYVDNILSMEIDKFPSTKMNKGEFINAIRSKYIDLINENKKRLKGSVNHIEHRKKIEEIEKELHLLHSEILKVSDLSKDQVIELLLSQIVDLNSIAKKIQSQWRLFADAHSFQDTNEFIEYFDRFVEIRKLFDNYLEKFVKISIMIP